MTEDVIDELHRRGLIAQSTDEAALRQRYEQEKARFVEPEQRLASHILIQVEPGADAAAQKAAEEKAAAKAFVEDYGPDHISFDFGDPGGITTSFLAKVPGPKMRLGQARMEFTYEDSFGTQGLEPYERLMYDPNYRSLPWRRTHLCVGQRRHQR